ncbi:MAG: phosphohistidine phosphatase SixA [bacterium]|nr:phosphohistidine phosphatase SixA [bacterium]
MKAYLVQHGEAKPKDEDADRPLSERGRADVGKAAAFLAAAGVRVGRILHSGRTRAAQTAALLAERLAPGGGVGRADGLDPLADAAAWAERLAAATDDTMLVGHLPHLARLSARLLRGDEERVVIGFTPGSVACMERDASGAWTLRWMLAPGLLP